MNFNVFQIKMLYLFFILFLTYYSSVRHLLWKESIFILLRDFFLLFTDDRFSPNLLSFSRFRYYIIFYLLNIFSVETFLDLPVINTEAGSLRGLYSEDGSYKMFLGVPYGKVLDENPFGLSIPHPNFETIFDANDDSKICPQIDEFTNEICGSLDSLRLNIYIPKTGKDFPVIVWIHGGRFEIGSGSRYLHGPKYFMKQKVIMVTINYRLGPYGFMCLDNSDIPGNQGIRDALMALRWIKKNIKYFGGSDSITVAGHSAGAFIVELLMRFDDDIFDKAILMSGTLSRPGSIKACDKTQPITLAAKLGFYTNDSRDALNFLIRTDPYLVVKAHLDSGIRYRPTKENAFPGVEQIVTDDINNLDKKNMKIIIGNCSAESILLFYHKTAKELKELDVFRNTLKTAFKFSTEELNSAEKIVRQFYIGDKEINEDVMLDITDFYSDFNFVFPIQKTVNSFTAQGLDVYYYVFSYNGHRNFIKKRNNMVYGGSSHADDLAYLFDLSFEDETCDNDQLIIDQMTEMWANFAKFGCPTPNLTKLLPTKWLPVTENEMYCLNINTDIKCGNKPMHMRMAFWDLFYKYYNKNIL